MDLCALKHWIWFPLNFPPLTLITLVLNIRSLHPPGTMHHHSADPSSHSPYCLPLCSQISSSQGTSLSNKQIMNFGLRQLWVQTSDLSLIGWEREFLKIKVQQGRELRTGGKWPFEPERSEHGTAFSSGVLTLPLTRWSPLGLLFPLWARIPRTLGALALQENQDDLNATIAFFGLWILP